jgi:hypothetical protein
MTHDMTTALDRLDRAVNDKGRNPGHHNQIEHETRHSWPALMSAVDAVLAARNRDKRARFAIEDETAREHIANALTMLDPVTPDDVAFGGLTPIVDRLKKALAAIDAGNTRPQ